MIYSTHKPFLTYEEQLEKLAHKGLVIRDKNYAINLFKEHSYFALISGYKYPFKQKNGQYKLHTSIEDIFALYSFDDALRTLFLRYILKVEKHIKSLISYVFCAKHGSEQSHYFNVTHYAYTQTNQQEINRFITELTKMEESPRYHYLKHQKAKHGNIPLWIMMKALPFSTVSKMYSFLPQSLKMEISKEFPHVHESMLQEMIALLSRIRNVCAHNERLFDYKDRQCIQDTDIHTILDIPVAKRQFKKGKRDIFAVLITLKYLIKREDFHALITELSNMLVALSSKVHNINLSQLNSYMGLPKNWEDIANCPKQKT